MIDDKDKDELPEEEAERIAREAIKRSFSMPHKPHKAIVGETPAGDAQARRRAKSRPKSEG